MGSWASKFVVSVLVLGSTASAQWLDLEEQTRSRLRIRPYVDATGLPPIDAQEKDLAAGDLDGDGWVDLVVVRKRPFSNPGPLQDILLMNEGGVLRDRTALFAPEFLTRLSDARDVAIEDLNGDGWLDVLVANTFGQQSSLYVNQGADAQGWLGLVDESSFRLPFISVPGDVNTLQICGVGIGDVTGNGAPDIYLSNYIDAGGTQDLLLINDGTGVFTLENDRLGEHANVAFGTNAEIRDMDNDGDQDVVKVSANYAAPPFGLGKVAILFNDGTGVFDSVPFQSVVPGFLTLLYMFTTADFDADGIVDVYSVSDLQDRVSLSVDVTPDSHVDYDTFVLQQSPRSTGFGGNLQAADLDNDGDLDLGLASIDVDIENCGASAGFTLLQNPGDGRLFDPVPGNEDPEYNLQAHDFAFLDLDRNGCLDIVMGLCQGWRIFMQTDCTP